MPDIIAISFIFLPDFHVVICSFLGGLDVDHAHIMTPHYAISQTEY